MDKRIIRIIEAIQVNLQNELDLDEMARAVNLSSSRLRHLFKAETGLSPAQYLKKLRMDRARELGEHTFMQVKEIMNAVGLKNNSHFTHTFKRAHGLTPSECRKGKVDSSIRRAAG
jgi:transcriptional regulator GlxA family with amidase domain